MVLSKNGANLYLPQGKSGKITHLAIGAHQDDVEIMAFHGISECYNCKDKGFFAVVATNGAGSPRNGKFKGVSDEKMCDIRRKEQIKASRIGKYGALAQLNFASSEIKSKECTALLSDLRGIFEEFKPKTVYIHNLADKHPTHVALALKCLEVMRGLPEELKPEKVLGCEVWRGLDWLSDKEKITLDISRHGRLFKRLISCFKSQIAGGKRYDIATKGRMLANATFSASHQTDGAKKITLAMDLTPLIYGDMCAKEFILSKIDLLRSEVFCS
ncbi:MAG: PIG-L family deacetylase [Firmicutes bacterium]|nr:PIG-L family deacetylase [Bacillota bacterium]